MMAVAIQRLNEGARNAVKAHFLVLPARDQSLRFGASLAPEAIAGYVDGIDFEKSAVFGAREGALVLVGVGHLAFEDGCAELALSVLPRYRGRGIGSALFKRAVAHSRNRRVPRLYLRFMTGNVPMMRMARRFGMDIVAGGGTVDAHLKLQPAPLAPIAAWTPEFADA